MRNIRYLQHNSFIRSSDLGLHIRMVLYVLERLLIQRSMQVFKLGYRFLHPSDCDNPVDLELADHRAKVSLEKCLVLLQDKRQGVEFQLEI